MPLNLTLLKGCQIVGVFWGAWVGMHPEENKKISIYGNAFEAIIGGIYLDKDFSQAASVVINLLEQEIESIKKNINVPIITDIHEEGQIEEISQVVDILQIPAFLCRQTDLISAACKTQLPLNIKKGQFLSPYQMKNIIEKCNSFGNDNIILCERGSSFGYDNLIVDFLGISEQKTFNYPIILDVTHSLQLPGGQGNSAGGRSHQAEDLARAAIALKISGLFIDCLLYTSPSPRDRG